MSARAGIVVTGTEVLGGRVQDRNGPWLSERLTELGVDLAYITVVGDRPEDMRAALERMREEGMDLVVTSGGLGPTADDLTAQVVADFQDRTMELDPELEAVIRRILEPLLKRWPDLDPEAIHASNRKQAMVPAGATVLNPVGTAPGLVVPPPEGRGGPTVVVLPGPPAELKPLWGMAAETEAFRAAIAGAEPIEQRMLRLFGIPESEIAETLRLAEDRDAEAFSALEITTCLRRGEVEVVTRFPPEQEAAYEAFEAVVRERHADTLFSDDGRSVDDQVADALLERGWRVAAAESCTGGLLLGRLTERPGSSAYVEGGAVVYSNGAKTELAGVPGELIAEHGAVSNEVAVALADGARSRFGADVGIGVTGIAGPDGGTKEKPVGLVHVSVAGPDGRIDRRVVLPGDRAAVRDRTTTVAMHLLRRVLLGEGDLPGA
jgi:competence/damage-inducible protein CinA-like protein